MSLKMIDRRNKALGGQTNDRARSNVTDVGVHWNGVESGTIESHERYWRDTLEWTNGGYHYFIDDDGVIYWNYNLTKTTNGVGGHNSTTAHVCYNGTFSNPMNTKQKQAIKYVINELMLPDLPNAKNVLGHNEFANTSRYDHSSNDCPGIDMDDFRAYLDDGDVKVPTKSKPTPNNTVAGAKLVKHEDGRFRVTATNGIKVRNAPSTNAHQTGVLNHDTQINYDLVYEGNGYRWLSYTGNSGDRLYVPYRPSGNINDQWGVFGDAAAKSKSKSAPKKKYPLPSGVYRVQQPMRQGNDVRQIQRALVAANYYPNINASDNGVDGWYGNDTADAVKRFQSMHRLTQDGVYGPATRKALDAEVN